MTCLCGRPAPDATLCRTCTKQLKRDLIDLPALADDLDVTLTRQDRVTPANDGGRSAETPLPLSLHASDALAAIRATLTSWCLLTCDEMGAHPPRDKIPNLALHLLGWLGDLVKHPAAGDLADEIRKLHLRGHAVLQPKDRARITVGPCPMVIDPDTDQESATGVGDPCPGQVTAIIPADSDDPPVMRCGACRHEWDSSQWLRAGMRIVGRQEAIERQRRLARELIGQAS